jgi:Glyoxalase-like domain
MAHFSRLEKVVIDVSPEDHGRELDFWQSAIGDPFTRLDAAEYHGARLARQGFAVLVQRLEEGGSRVHLDIHTSDLDAEVERLERLGATRVRQARSWWIMRDPAGLLFCVIPTAAGKLTDDNAYRWE